MTRRLLARLEAWICARTRRYMGRPAARRDFGPSLAADLILDLTGCGVFSYENTEKVMARADAEHAALWDVIAANGATNSRLMAERDAAHRVIQVQDHKHRGTLAAKDQRLQDVVSEYQKAGASWDTTRELLTAERDEARTTIETLQEVVTGRGRALTEARDAIGRVLAVHIQSTPDATGLTWCGYDVGCGEVWPCSTIRALDAPTEPAPELVRCGGYAGGRPAAEVGPPEPTPSATIKPGSD